MPTTHQNTESETLCFYEYSCAGDLPASAVLCSISLENNQLACYLNSESTFIIEIAALTGYSFEINYYRHCPIPDKAMSVAALEHSSPVSFWTILIIASRWHPVLHNLYWLLLGPYRGLLAKTLIEPIRSIESIQVVVLLCFWPLAVPGQVDDPKLDILRNHGQRCHGNGPQYAILVDKQLPLIELHVREGRRG